MKNKSLSVQTLNIRINSLRKYFEHLKEEGIIEINPARRLYIKGKIKKVIVNPLSYIELEQLYHEYAKPKEHYREEKHRKAHERNSIILGLMIWQAVHSGELNKIEINHVKLNEGIIYLPATRRSKSRELKLESKQIILLHQYITELKFTSEKLFECHPSNTIQYLTNELKGINPVIRNAQHIRASVILHWMKMYDKRQVQYMAGHKWISSTEHYEVQELTGLTDLLTKHHPFS
jgi:integrase/recombinase XerD